MTGERAIQLLNELLSFYLDHTSPLEDTLEMGDAVDYAISSIENRGANGNGTQ